MYYKLPVKERIELMKSYRKANKDMSYHDMVKDYNDSYEKFDNGGIKKEVPEYQSKDLKDYIYRKQMYNDSLNLSKNSLYELRELNKSDMTYNKFKDIQNHSQTSRAKEAYDNLTKTNGVKPNPSTKVGKEFTNTAFKQEFGSVNIYQPPKQSILPPKGEVKNELTKVNTFVKNQNREPIITHDKNDPRLRAYNDSLDTYQWNKKALDKVLSTGKSPLGSNVDKINYKKHSKEEQLNLDYKKYKDWGLDLTKKDVDSELAAVDPYNKGTKKLNRAISYYDFSKEVGGNFKLAQYKKPVQPYKYEPENSPVEIPPIIPPVVNSSITKQDTIQYTPKQPVPNSDTTRRWNFNGSNPVMEYYDKSGKLIKKEYYTGVNGKKIKPLTK